MLYLTEWKMYVVKEVLIELIMSTLKWKININHSSIIDIIFNKDNIYVLAKNVNTEGDNILKSLNGFHSIRTIDENLILIKDENIKNENTIRSLNEFHMVNVINKNENTLDTKTVMYVYNIPNDVINEYNLLISYNINEIFDRVLFGLFTNIDIK